MLYLGTITSQELISVVDKSAFGDTYKLLKGEEYTDNLGVKQISDGDKLVVFTGSEFLVQDFEPIKKFTDEDRKKLHNKEVSDMENRFERLVTNMRPDQYLEIKDKFKKLKL